MIGYDLYLTCIDTWISGNDRQYQIKIFVTYMWNQLMMIPPTSVIIQMAYIEITKRI